MKKNRVQADPGDAGRLLISFCVFGGTLLVLSLFWGCTPTGGRYPEKEHLFSLDIGRMEDQIDLLKLPGVPFDRKTRLSMRNGLFYISNGNSGKVMEFSGYGDILSLFYNPDINPPPVLLVSPRDSEQTNQVVNRRAFSYRFNDVGEIAVTSNRSLLMDDKMPEQHWEYDHDIDAMLNRIVLWFDKDGRLKDYLGQEGFGGTPFPHIESLQVTANDEIVVICRSVKTWEVFWYSTQGALKYAVSLPLVSLPLPADSEGYYPALEAISADVQYPYLHLKIDYHVDGSQRRDPDTHNVYYGGSRIWRFDIEDEKYVQSIQIPRKRIIEDNAQLNPSGVEVEVIYDFLGNSKKGYFFLLAPEGDERFELLVIEQNGTVVERIPTTIRDRRVVLRDFYVSHEGIVTALIAEEFNVDIVWWRTDRLLNLSQ